MEAPKSLSTPPRRRRAAKACQFCRKRKLKCGEEEPQCTNCKTYGKECSYVALPKKNRARITDLERENRRLQARLSNVPEEQSSRSPEDGVDVAIVSRSLSARCNESPNLEASVLLSPALPSVDRETPTQVLEQQPQSAPRPRASSNHQSSYYGRTSALFDDEPPDTRALRGSIPSTAGGISDRTQLLLMAEAAKQRQMETINYNAGRLDFDGVDPELGMHLLSLHWNRQHHSSLITYRPAFMRDMACQGPYFSKLLLNAIFFGASKFSPRPELRSNREHVRSVGLPFRQRVRELLGGALDRSEITTIQALLIMTSSLFALGDERSAAWLYAGTAFRMIIDLGLHVDDLSRFAAHPLTEEDFEIRRRVFWGAFVVDKIQSLYQGRPMSLQEADTRVPMTFQDRYEELEHWMPFAYSGTRDYPGSPAYSVSTFTELCKLSVIMNNILNNIYAEKSVRREPQQLAEDLKNRHGDLEKWEAALPLHLRFDVVESTGIVPPPHVLSLQAMHKVLLILLHRPFVSEGHLHLASPSIPENSFVICAMAATKIVQLLRFYDQTFSIQHAPYLMSYATYVAATIHVRIAAQRDSGSEAHASLATCLSVFDKNQETNWAVRRAKTVILNLMKRMNVTLPEESNSSSEGSGLEESTIMDPNNGGMSTIPHFSNARLGINKMASDFNMDPMFHAGIDAYGSIAPDLDMEAIIQSFIHEQSFADASQSYLAVRGFDSAGIATGSSISQNTAPVTGAEFNYAGTGVAWNNLMEYHQVEGSVEDMLFGFNRGVW